MHGSAHGRTRGIHGMQGRAGVGPMVPRWKLWNTELPPSTQAPTSKTKKVGGGGCQGPHQDDAATALVTPKRPRRISATVFSRILRQTDIITKWLSICRCMTLEFYSLRHALP